MPTKLTGSGSASSGEGDEFFDAVEHLEEDSSSATERRGGSRRLEPLRESTLEDDESISSPPTPKQELRDEWVSARWDMKDAAKNSSDGSLDHELDSPGRSSFGAEQPSEGCEDKTTEASVCSQLGLGDAADRGNSEISYLRSQSLLDAVQSESVSYEETADDEQRNPLHGNSNKGNSEKGEAEIGGNDATDDGETAATAKPIVPPINLGALRPRYRDDSNVLPKTQSETKDVVETKYDEEDLQTLNRLVDKLQAVSLTRQVEEKENATKKEESKIDDAIPIVQQHEIKQEDVEQYQTPQKILDCGNVTDIVCDAKSPLEALYLFCPETLSYSARGASERSWRTSAVTASSPTRTSITNEDDTAEEASPREQKDTKNERRQLDWESDSSDDYSSASGDEYTMMNKDTGSVHDMRDVMKQIDEAGSTDALDTRYSILPTKGQLRRMAFGQDLDSKDSDEPPNVVPLTVASFDSGIAEGSTPRTPNERKRIGVKFGNKMAANVRKGVSHLKSSRQQKINRKHITSVDMLPSNAIHVRSSSRQKQSAKHSSGISDHSQDIQADSSFNPMLLIKTVANAHTGPAWCAAFSPNGRFLATGGEDGNVCIWAVSPKSKAMHPNGIPTQQDESPTEVSAGEDAKNVEHLPKEEDQKTPAPPLHFIGTGPELATNLEILSSEPIQRFKDHTADVIDLSWSHTNFLLSASIDSSVRLYHFTKPGCLHLFKHANLVASVAFHPTDDRYFISGGIDKKLRMWDITDGRVKEWAQAPDVITAARFTPDGKYAVAGLFRGQVYFYDVNGLKYYTQIACRNRSGKNRMGKKVTGISFVRGERDDWLQGEENSNLTESSVSGIEDASSGSLSDRLSGTGKDMARRVSSAFRNGGARPEALRYTERMLVSTNDSRVRLYGLNDFCLVRKYKGHTNYSMQICARISESGSHIACGSESGQVFIWDTEPKIDKNRPKRSTINMNVHQTHDKAKSSNHFEATKASLPIVTDSVFFPSMSMDEALLSSEKVFPFSLGMDRVYDDMSNAAILTLDYDGTMRVFLRKSCIDNILDAATPRGGTVC